ncbi:MAG: NifU N-terminal domain-containing protein [Planctomycetaceae bacterium]
MTLQVTPQPTPNPNAYKFVLGGKRFDKPVTFASAAAARGTPFAEALFRIAEVQSIFCTADFVTVTKGPGGDWGRIVPAATEALRAHLH